jgi:hypothetical protein
MTAGEKRLRTEKLKQRLYWKPNIRGLIDIYRGPGRGSSLVYVKLLSELSRQQGNKATRQAYNWSCAHTTLAGMWRIHMYDRRSEGYQQRIAKY